MQTLTNQKENEFIWTPIPDNINVSNATLYIYNSTNSLIGTNFTILGNSSIQTNISYTLNYTGIFHWNFLATDSSNNQAFNHTNYTLTFSAPSNISTNVTYDTNLTYDNNGNLISGFDKNYTYNSFNDLTAITNSTTGNIIEQYAYDNEGNRLKKTTYNIDDNGNNQTTYYISDNFIQTRYTNGTILNETYIYANGKLLAKKDNSNNKQYHHPDHLGSTTLLTNQSQNIIEEEFYLPYGDIYFGNEESRHLFTGQEKDKSTNLYYYGARYYNSLSRQFIQPDSLIADIYNPQNLNRYSYVLNNPYKYVDPEGNAVWIPAAVGGVIGAGDFAYQYFVQGQSLGTSLAHGGTTAVATTASLYAPLIIGSAALAGTATFTIGAANSLIQQKIEDPSTSLQNALSEAGASGFINVAVPSILGKAKIPGIVNYGRQQLASATSKELRQQFVSDLIVEGTTSAIDEGVSSIFSSSRQRANQGNVNYNTLPTNNYYNQYSGGPLPTERHPGSDGVAYGSGGRGSSSSSCGCGCSMSCPKK